MGYTVAYEMDSSGPGSGESTDDVNLTLAFDDGDYKIADGELSRERQGRVATYVVPLGEGAGGRVDGEVRQGREQLLEHDAPGQPGGGGTQAVVGTVAEGEDPPRSALDVELLGVVTELARVTVRGGVQQQDPRSCGDPTSPKLDLAGRGAGQALDRAREPEELLDGVRDQVRGVDQLLPLVAVLGQQLQGDTEQAGRRVVATGDHGEGETEHLQDADVVAGPRELRDRVLAGLGCGAAR